MIGDFTLGIFASYLRLCLGKGTPFGRRRCIGPIVNVRPINCSRGLTLIEVLLALGLTVLVTGLIGGLIQIYQGSLDTARDNVRQARLARSVLTMIADDIRGSLRQQNNDDAATLEKFLASNAISSAKGGGQNGGGGGGQSGSGGGNQGGNNSNSGNQAGAGQNAGGPQNASGGQNPQSGGQTSASGQMNGTASGGMGASGTATSDPLAESTATASPPPGIFGTETAIEIDVSRPPRPDEYMGQLANPMSSELSDVPSDTKTVSYFVQAPQLNGVQDPLLAAAGGGLMSNGGLVRRSLDRAVTRWAYSQGQIDRISSTGQLIAPEIVAISFSYFDGMQWLPTWDSTAQGLPLAIQITIAMQHSKQAREMPITPGMTLQALMALPLSETGLETYSMLAIVPGAQLLKTPADQTTTDGSASPTSSFGF